jgi:phosphoglycolate phosphatase-like HAD superfamily hydrolase
LGIVAPRHLVILDVDGTLVHSLEAEALLFPRACEQALNIRGISSNWESYRCPSDRGIVRELIEQHFGREADEDEYLKVEQRFLELIREYYAEEPELCRPVSGANEAVSRFREIPEFALSVATAGWHRTALHKLAVAGVYVQDLPIATSHDAEWKADIMRIAADRASEHYGVSDFETVVCFGDSKGDAKAAGDLGFEFIGIDTSGFVAEEKHRFADFSALDEIVRTMRVLQKARCAMLSVNGGA